MYRPFLAYAFCALILACGPSTPGPSSDSGLAPVVDSGVVPDSGAATDSGPVVDAGTVSDAGQQPGADASHNETDAANPPATDAGVEPPVDAGQANPDTCGGIQGARCSDGLVCDLSDNRQCGDDLAGQCIEPRGGDCPAVHAPECGCDGNTYGNECMRRAAYVAISHVGPCDQGGAQCGGIAGMRCPPRQVCDLSAHAQCGADLMGVCVDSRTDPCTREHAPVCGCDGHTYPNDCHRQNARVAFDHEGPC